MDIKAIKLKLTDIILKIFGRKRYSGRINPHIEYDVITKKLVRHNKCRQTKKFGFVKSMITGDVIRNPRRYKKS